MSVVRALAGRGRCSEMPKIDPAQVLQLPVPFMNADHAHEVLLVNAVEAALAAHRRGEGTLGAVVEQLSLLAGHPLATLLGGAVLAIPLYLGMWLLMPGGRSELAKIKSDLLELLKPRR